MVNPHGDVVATANSSGAIGSYSVSDEYGNPPTGTAAQRYGWLGQHQRSTDTVGGLTLMGVRLYNPTSGQFLSADPINRGNVTSYTYPQDPVNDLDPSGAISYGKLHTSK